MPTNPPGYMHKYYLKNKDYFYEKIKCECGFSYPRYNLWEHKKTKKHARYLHIIKQYNN